MSSDFVHLHVHSDYSILDGLNTLPQLLDRCEKFGMNACALTDHGNLFGAVEFFKTARARGIKPIIGSELYVAPVHRTEKKANAAGAPYHHMVLLCENETGYHNLCRLSTIGYLEGFYQRPRVDDELLAKHHEGLIATSGCIGGRIPQSILNENLEAAHASIRKYIDIFGKDNFLIEIMDHGLPEERRANPVLIAMAKQYGLTLVATNDAHYLDREDSEAHEVLLCAQTQTTMEDPNRFRFQTDEFYFRSQQEMERLFASCPEAVLNTRRIAERCNAEIPLYQSLIPKFVPPEGRSKEAYLRDLVMEGLPRRYGTPVPPEILERARFELRVIEEMKFVDYFLVVWDLIRYAREAGIPVGPGRGSGAGSIVAYALHITNIDPIRYNLLFERFLNPDRISMPDFDIDFCYNRRDEMIKYARDRYGAENVSQIITFGRMLARQVIRNVGRVLAMPYGEVDRIAKLIPEELKITLKSALEKEPDLRRIIAEDPQVARLWRLAERLEGTINNCGTHAAGVVISDQPLTDHIALFKAANSDTVCTQVEMKGVEDIGLLKMDFLGLRTLTVVHEAARLVRQHRGISIDIDNLEPNDEATYELLRSGQTTGVFQLESPGMRDLAKRIGLQSLEEICALVALYRPGPMQFIDTYVENKYNPERIRYDHPKLEPILKETYGIALYQEQVMQIVQALAGFSLGEADILRRAMGKKKADLMAEQRGQFVEGCQKNGIPAKLASELFDKIETFAGYGFNKSHSMAYAFVAYQTAYLKAHYPVEFMCALLTSESGNLDKVGVYVEECRRMNIDVLPPDVNHSFTAFSVEENAIRFGLSAIKNVGVGPTEAIVAERESGGPFKDVFDFCRRLDSRIANKRLLESLNRAGAFASTGWNRRQIEAVLESALCEAQIAKRDRDSGQISLFELTGMENIAETIHVKPDLPEWPEYELLQTEKEMLGLYVTNHPLQRHADTLRRFSTLDVSALSDLPEGLQVSFGGIITQLKTHITGRGKMAFLTVESLEGRCEVTIFNDLYEQKAGLLMQDEIIMLRARLSMRNNAPSLVALDLFPIADAEKLLSTALHIRVPADRLKDGFPQKLAELLGEHRGPCDVYLHCTTPDFEEVVIHATNACRVAPTRALRAAIEKLTGESTVWCSAGMGFPSHAQPKIPLPEQPRWKRRKMEFEEDD